MKLSSKNVVSSDVGLELMLIIIVIVDLWPLLLLLIRLFDRSHLLFGALRVSEVDANIWHIFEYFVFACALVLLVFISSLIITIFFLQRESNCQIDEFLGLNFFLGNSSEFKYRFIQSLGLFDLCKILRFHHSQTE